MKLKLLVIALVLAGAPAFATETVARIPGIVANFEGGYQVTEQFRAWARPLLAAAGLDVAYRELPGCLWISQADMRVVLRVAKAK